MPDYPSRLKRLRARYGFTQRALADRLGVSFVTVNRWENDQVEPSQLSWTQLRKLEDELIGEALGGTPKKVIGPVSSPNLDFSAQPEAVKLLAEGERLSFGHLANPVFAAEISNIDPLPHQRIAVYDHMLKQTRLRFLLADDAGAGKTIMAGLYIREMLSRRLIRRILIVPPAGLVGNWRHELFTLFNLPFRIVDGSDAIRANPFLGDESDQLIISIDTLTGQRVFDRLRNASVVSYDLVIFDEAHKLSSDRGIDLRVRKTDRYCLAEAIAGAPVQSERWRMNWRAHHLLLLTATPHMGKEYPYFALWRLLEPEMLAAPEAFNEFPPEERRSHFIRRTKEELVRFDGQPLYPPRFSDTLAYDLSQGEISEQRLYDETTDYLQFVYNRAKLLNREAARLVMSVFQRRLASSTYALLRSLERRLDKLDALISNVQEGKLTEEQLILLQKLIGEEDDVLDSKTADEETVEDGREENEVAEDNLLQGVVASSLADLLAEREHVKGLIALGRKVFEAGQESKFERLREVLADPSYADEKLIIFTEHRDTLDFLVRRLNGLGFTGQIAQIHGGMSPQPDTASGLSERDRQVEFFRCPNSEGGAHLLVCTDAAGEGINLQFCWIMINYDVPWNPARLEQRMGRIHRYGQKHDKVIILNLVAPRTREGKVLQILLDKLERIRKELNSDKVFDCIGRVFEGVSIKQYMELALTGDVEKIAHDLDGRLTKEQVLALQAREKALYGSGGDVVRELPRLRVEMDQEVYFRLVPGYVRQYIQQAAPLLGIEIDGDLGGVFFFRPARPRALDPLLPVLELYPEDCRENFCVSRLEGRKDVIWLHPGEPVFERFRTLVGEHLTDAGIRGAVFVDPTATNPYLFHMAHLCISRKPDPELSELAKEEVLECRLVGVRQTEGAEISLCPVEHLLLLRGGEGLPASAQRLAASSNQQKELASAFIAERVGREMALERRGQLLAHLEERETYVIRSFDYQEAELATARAKHAEKARSGNRKALDALEEVKQQQRELVGRREHMLAVLRREPDLISPGEVIFVAHALVVPSSNPEEIAQHEINVELAAMQVVRAFEEAEGGKVIDVHTPELARAAGLQDNPGFDLLSNRPRDGNRAIEVKGRSATGDIEVSANEWAKACNMREGYWIYAVYDCASPNPRLIRVQDPFARLLAKAKGSVLIGAKQVVDASVESADMRKGPKL
jgi:SNF2 family DNA or RNA helicase